MAQNKHVTLVITHTLRPDQAQRYEQWLGKIMPLAAEFPGHLGANVIRPTDGQNLWNIIIRFDTLEHLYNWTQSDTRRELVEEIAPLLAEGDKTEVRTEAAFWFTPPAPCTSAQTLEAVFDNAAGDFPQYQPGAVADRYSAAFNERLVTPASD